MSLCVYSNKSRVQSRPCYIQCACIITVSKVLSYKLSVFGCDIKFECVSSSLLCVLFVVEQNV